MKKILCVLLALACVFAVASCADETLTAFNDAAANTSPAKIDLYVEQTTVYGPFVLDIETVYAEDGSATITGTRTVLNSIESGSASDVVATVLVNVTCDASGNYSDGGEFSGNTAVASGVRFDFKQENMTYTVSANGNELNATVAADKTEATFGVSIAADVTVTVIKNDGKIVSFTMDYTTAEGAVHVTCVYN